MPHFQLPLSTNVNRVIPKNSFDAYTNTRQKKLFADLVDKIRWTNKLSLASINLSGKDIPEIQIFEIDLKRKANISELLTVIDRAIPYHIIFVILVEDSVMFSTSKKHPHPSDENSTVIDWTFSANWLAQDGNHFQLNLKQNLDYIFTDFCKQLLGRSSEKISIAQLINKEQRVAELNKAIATLQAAVKATRQFNKKVELNMELQKKITALSDMQ